MQFVKDLIFPGCFIPHGVCYLRTWSQIGLHAVSDSLVAISTPPILIPLAHHFRETLYAPGVHWLPVDQPSLRQAVTNRMEKRA
jgi:hypothetical protein